MITEFKGKYDWLSNFAPAQIESGIYIFPSVEHAYMSEKSNADLWKMFCVETESAGKVKVASRSLFLPSDWHETKVEIMNGFLIKKFSHEPYRTLLINTGSQLISEGNWWNDTFWGVCLKLNSGQNILGKLIMKIRRNLNGK
jgi:ribA/ribD-fused uncharacterized protein